MSNFLSHLLIHAKSLSNDVHPLKRPRKCLKSIFDNYFPENLLKFGIILNDFPSFSISEFNLPIPGTDFKQTCVNYKSLNLKYLVDYPFCVILSLIEHVKYVICCDYKLCKSVKLAGLKPSSLEPQILLCPKVLICSVQ